LAGGIERIVPEKGFIDEQKRRFMVLNLNHTEFYYQFMAVYSISDLAKISGIKAHTIRIWERRYKIVKPMRTSTNIRYYSDEDLKRLLNISILSSNGFKISKIADLNDSQIRDRVIDLCLDTRNQNVQVESLIVSMLEFDDQKFVEVLTNSIIKQGFEQTVESILFPFLERIGVLWQAGSIYPAQEHFISNLIRQKLIVAIDGEMSRHKKSNTRIVFFLPEGEYHELGLLFYSLIARKENLDVLYLGASVPLADLKQIDEVRPAQMFFTFFVASREKDDFDSVVKDLSTYFSDRMIYVSGLYMKEEKPSLPYPFRVVASVDDFKKYLAEYRNY
jgi:MerR family transcriptional regulator, light-induced transcriptional regulator